MVNKRNIVTVLVILLSIMLLASCGGGDSSHDENPDIKKSFEKGNAYYKFGNIEAAIKEYEKTILYDRTHKMAHYNLAVLYREKGRFTEAIHEFEEYLKYAGEEDEVVKKYVESEIKNLKHKN